MKRVDNYHLMRYYDKVIKQERCATDMRIEVRDEKNNVIFSKEIEKNSDYELNVLQQTINMTKIENEIKKIVPYH